MTEGGTKRQRNEGANAPERTARRKGQRGGETRGRAPRTRRTSRQRENAPRSWTYLKSCQKATAELAATFSESTPRDMGMMTDRSQAASARRERP